MSPAAAALSLLFKKLHPHLEDAAHALSKDANKAQLERMHLKLLKARDQVAQSLIEEAERLNLGELRDHLETLAENLQPLGEPYRDNLILTQLCLEAWPEALLPFVPEPERADASWAKRLMDFETRLAADPAYQAEQRWLGIDEEIGDDVAFDED
jgi:hypothetical protein